ncbi:Protein MAIN-LIKE 1 [Glycine soja]
MCKQREAAPIAEDVQHVDHSTNEVHEQPEEAAVDDVVPDAEGFPRGPRDTSVLIGYVDYVAVIVWNGEERPELKLSSHGRKVHKFGRPTPEIEGLVVAIGLSPLTSCSLDTGDWELISAYMERWHKETSSFHLPIGVPITGAFHSFEALHMDEAVLVLIELLEVSADEARAETVQCHWTYVQLSWLRDIYHSKCDVAQWTVAARAYLLHLLFEYLAPVGQICVVPGQCAADYMEWFYMIFQPFMSPTQLGDPPRHPSVMHNDTFVELDIPQHPVVATTMDTAPVDAPGHAEQPRHSQNPRS